MRVSIITKENRGDLWSIFWQLSYAYSIIYAGVYHGFWWAVLSIVFPVLPLYDLVVRLGKI